MNAVRFPKAAAPVLPLAEPEWIALSDLPRPKLLIAMCPDASAVIAVVLPIDPAAGDLERHLADSNDGGTSCGDLCAAVTPRTPRG